MKSKGFLWIMMILILAGCSSSTFDKAMEQSELALANQEYEKALASVELALREKPEDTKALAIQKDLQNFESVKEEMRSENWAAALHLSKDMLSQKELSVGLRETLQELIQTVTNNQEMSAQVSAHVKDIEKSVEAGELEEAEKLIEELRTNQISAGELSEKLDKLEKRMEEELNKPQPSVAQQPPSSTQQLDSKPNYGTQQEFLNKLNAIEIGLADLDHLYVNGITSEMAEGETERYKRWDDALNEIYGVLKKQLSPADMEQLRLKQREWIQYRDDTASFDSAEFAGGSFEPVTYTGTSAELTRERCYELVHLYMN